MYSPQGPPLAQVGLDAQLSSAAADSDLGVGRGVAGKDWLQATGPRLWAPGLLGSPHATRLASQLALLPHFPATPSQVLMEAPLQVQSRCHPPAGTAASLLPSQPGADQQGQHFLVTLSHLGIFVFALGQTVVAQAHFCLFPFPFLSGQGRSLVSCHCVFFQHPGRQ